MNRDRDYEEREYGLYWYSGLWRILRPILVGITVLVLVIGISMTVWNKLYGSFVAPVDPEDTREYTFEVGSGESLNRVATNLEDAGLIRNRSVFKYYCDFAGMSQKIQVGSYAIRKDMSMNEIAELLTTGDGNPLVRNITLIPGETIEEFAARLVKNGVFESSDAFLAACKDGKWGARTVRGCGKHEYAHMQAFMRYNHCCVNNIPRGFMDVAQTLVSRDAEGTVYINWYSDSRSAIDGVRVQVTGNYPVGGEVAVQVETSAPLKVRLRVPAWAAGGRMTVDGVAAQPGWFETSIGGPHCFRIHFDLTPIVANSDKPAVERYAADDKRITKWNSNGNDADITALTRSTPMAQVFRGPLLLAKCKRVGDSEAEIFTKKSINRQGYTCTADALDNENVWGAWLLTLSNGKERFRVKASDYASSGDEELPRGANAFSVFF